MTRTWPGWLQVAVRWLVATVVVALLVVAMLHLSRWQWHKHVARSAEITTQQRNLTAPAVPVTSLLTASGVDAAQEWREVRVTGTYDVAHQLVVTLRTVGGVGGSEVLTPLRTPAGLALLVDRGFYPVPDDAPPGSPGQAPRAPAGQVTVTGYLRRAEPAGRAPNHQGDQVLLTRIDPTAVAAAVPYAVPAGYLSLVSSTPRQPGDLQPLAPPTYDSGPYLSYSVQWVIFCVIAVGGLVMLAVDEFAGGRLRARLRPDEAGPPVALAGGPPVAGAPPVAAAPLLTTAPVLPGPARARPLRPTVLAGGASPPALPADFYDDPDDVDPDAAVPPRSPATAADRLRTPGREG